MVDLGQNSDCSESESESKSEGESGTIIEHKISLQQEIKEPEISKTLVNYTESSDTSDDCPKNVEHDLKTDSPNSKDPLMQMPNHLLIVRNKVIYPLRWKNWKENWQKRKKMRRTYSPAMKITGQFPLWMR